MFQELDKRKYILSETNNVTYVQPVTTSHKSKKKYRCTRHEAFGYDLHNQKNFSSPNLMLSPLWSS